MRNQQENKFTMYKAVDTYLDENQPIVTSIAEFRESHLQLKNKYAALKNKDDEKKTAFKGKAVSKLMARDNAINASLAISGGLYAYAKKTENHELASLTNIQKSNLDLMRDTEVIQALEALKDLANARLSELEPFGITQAKLTSYSDKITVFDDAIGKKETGMVRKKGATKSLKILFIEADEVLSTIDKFVNGMTSEHPDFVRNYNNARTIMNLGVRHRKEEPPGNPPEKPPGNTQIAS